MPASDVESPRAIATDDGPIAALAARLASRPWAVSGGVALLAAVVLWVIVAPLSGVLRDTDATSTVLYFERIVHGQRLEAFVPTTPKPLLTAVYGLIWTLTSDWRWVTIASLLVAAGAIGMAFRLTWRLGGAAAAAIVVVAMLAWPDLQLEISHANSFVWGLALWLLAAVFVTADRPRPWLAGIALMLAGLARTETVWLLGAAFLCAAWSVLTVWRGADRAVFRTTLPPLLGFLSLPLACLHDWLLTGQPLYWLGVPAGYTSLVYPDMASESPIAMLAKEAVYFRPALVLLPLALIGWLLLVRARRLAISLALACLAGGVLLTLVILGWRGVYISVRYYEEADAVVLLTAAIAVSAILGQSFDLVARRLAAGSDPGPRRSAWRVAGPLLAAGAIALGAVAADVPQGTLAAPSQLSIDAEAALAAHLDDLRPILVGATGTTVKVPGVGYPVTDAGGCRIFVPRPLLFDISIRTGAPITSMCDSMLAFRDGLDGLAPGRWVLHIRAADGLGASPFLEGPQVVQTRTAKLKLTPVIVDEARGFWLIRIDAAN